jgi:hypothetical protein
LVVDKKDVDRLVNTLVDLNNGGIAGLHGSRYGDANLDGSVGGADFNAFLDRVGPGWANGDWDGNGSIGGADFNLFLDRPTSAYGGGSISVVPEPATIGLLGFGGLAMLLSYRRRSKLVK